MKRKLVGIQFERSRRHRIGDQIVVGVNRWTPKAKTSPLAPARTAAS
jgi:hypothetical protein